MNKIDLIEGFWKADAYEQNGIPWSKEECRQRAWLVLCSDIVIPGSNGIWGEIKYLTQPTVEVASKSLRSLRQLINGKDYERSQDHYLYSGGIVNLGVTEDGTNSIDLVAYHGSYITEPEHSICRGIYRCDENYLTVCLVDETTKTRPLYFSSMGTPYQSLNVYIREDYSDQVLRQGSIGSVIDYTETQRKQPVA